MPPDSLILCAPFSARRWVWPLVLWLCGVTCGCHLAAPPLDLTYRRGGDVRAAEGINGTGALFQRLQRDGKRISVSRRWGKGVEQADTVVWFVQDNIPVPPPSAAAIESWFGRTSGRRLIVVSYGYEATRDYWRGERQRTSLASPDYLAVRLEDARASAAAVAREGAQIPWEIFGAQVKSRSDIPRGTKGVLSGPWSQNLLRNDSTAHLPAEHILEITPEENQSIEDFLRVDGEIFAAGLSRPTWGNGQVVVVADAIFLLNYSLLDATRLRLAESLLESLTSAKRIVFLESGGHLEVGDGSKDKPLGTAFHTFPTNVLLLHASLAGLIFGFAVFPIFGRPRVIVAERVGDFSLHTEAVGRLLTRSRDESHARGVLRDWNQGRTSRSRDESPEVTRSSQEATTD